jgi:HD-GYP domain-containing protein (c-di-GMP phosphodiesterase class II)
MDELRPSAHGPEFRLAELLAALSLATDLANSSPPERSLRNALLAVRLGERLGLEGQDLSDIYYASMLRYISCTAFAQQEAALNAGDDISFRAVFAGVDTADPEDFMARAQAGMGVGLSSSERTELVGRFFAQAPTVIADLLATACEAGSRLAERLAMSAGVRLALTQAFERWDGQGAPAGLRGEQISLAARVTEFVHVVLSLHHQRGRAAAIEAARHRSGSAFDPQLCSAFLAAAPDLLAEVEAASVWDAALAAEPQPRPWLPASRQDDLARAFADFTDLKCTFTLGHSSAVAELARDGARTLGLPEPEVITVYRAGLLHDIGRVSVPNGIWEKPGPLSAAEWERVRLHPYYSDRIISRCGPMRALAALAGMHHERLNGSGYHRALPATMIPTGGRLLAAADEYQALTVERPYREARPPAAAAAQLRADGRESRLDVEALEAILAAAGHRRERRRLTWPAGLSQREVEVLRLVCTGHSNRDAADRLSISELTVHGHVRNIYSKTGVSTRAGAALYAMEHDLIHA